MLIMLMKPSRLKYRAPNHLRYLCPNQDVATTIVAQIPMAFMKDYLAAPLFSVTSQGTTVTDVTFKHLTLLVQGSLRHRWLSLPQSLLMLRDMTL